MISIFRYNKKWRITIKNETLEFEDKEDFEDKLSYLIRIKERFEPYKWNDH